LELVASRQDPAVAWLERDRRPETACHDLASEHLADLRRIDARLRDARARVTAAVRASGPA